MTVPRHPGSRVVPHPPNLLRVIRKIQADVAALRNWTRPETLTFTDAVGLAFSGSTFQQMFLTRVYRSGHQLTVLLTAATGTDCSVEARLSVPDLSGGIYSPAVASPVGGQLQDIKLRLDLPDAWAYGDSYRVFVEARQTAGASTPTLSVMRAVQR